MSDLLQQGSNFLEDQRHKYMSRQVRYTRGVESILLNATIGRTVFEEQDQFGTIQRTESRDYLIRSDDLILFGEKSEPTVGDIVIESVNTVLFTYQVMSFASEPPFRFSDPERKTLRVHTKLINVLDIF